jgi:regulator of nonsense transcripts 2
MDDDLWDDEETKAFYTKLPDIGILAPGLCPPTKSENEQKLDGNSYENGLSERKQDGNPENDIDEEELDEEDESIPASTQVDQIQSRLLGSLNKEVIDQIAVDFAWINSKGARKRLSRFILLHSKSRADLIPFFGRLIACFNPYIPEISQTVIKLVRFNH